MNLIKRVERKKFNPLYTIFEMWAGNGNWIFCYFLLLWCWRGDSSMDREPSGTTALPSDTSSASILRSHSMPVSFMEY